MKLTITQLKRLIKEELDLTQGSMRMDDPLEDVYNDDLVHEDPLHDLNCDCGEFLDTDGSCPVCGPHPPSRGPVDPDVAIDPEDYYSEVIETKLTKKRTGR